MSAVLRLTWTCFSATPLTKRLAVLGMMAIAIGTAATWWLGGYSMIFYLGRNPDWYDLVAISLPFLGLILLVASTILLPAIIERMALGRAIWVLPGGRLRLLISTALPPVILAGLVAAGATVSLLSGPFEVPLSFRFELFRRILLMAFIDFGVIYCAIWLVGKTSGVWRLAGTLLIVISITIPFRYLGRYFGGDLPPFTLLEGLGLAVWGAYAAVLLTGGRARHSLQTLRELLRTLAARAFPSDRYATGRETDLMLGTTRPWIVALGQAIPIGIMVWLVPYPPIWIMFLVTFSAIAGAITSQAAARSRRLWLQYDWTREELRRRVEWAYWRYNAWSLGCLLVIYVGLMSFAGTRGGYEGLVAFEAFDRQAISWSLALIALGGIACTYLGLMITRGLGWFESALGILTMLALVLAAFAILRQQFLAAIELQAVLAALSVTYAYIARRRWRTIDWMQCRLEQPARRAA